MVAPSLARWLTVCCMLVAPMGARAIDVAVTFDDLPGGGAEIDAVLGELAERGWQQVAGFVNGGPAQGSQAARGNLERWVVGGQRLGNHTFSHADLTRMTTQDYLDDLRRNEPLLRDVSQSADAWKLFRYPFLFEGNSPAQYQAIRAALAHGGYRIAQVTIDPYDWAWDAPFNRCRAAGDTVGLQQTQDAFVADALAQLAWADTTARQMFGRPIQHILLLHIRSLTAATLPRLLDAFVAADVTFVPLDAALADPVYAISTAGSTFVSGTFLRQLMRRHPDSPIAPPPPHPMEWMDSLCR